MSGNIFKRYEIKYVLSEKQYLHIKNLLDEHMILDEYKKHLINNIYYDTDNYLLIRESIEKPVYKEKVRLRWYNTLVSDDEKVFLELKKKYNKIVYKRRIKTSYKKAVDFLNNVSELDDDSQIAKEIMYCHKRYSLVPKVLLSYEREAYYGKLDKDFRITFDCNISFRDTDVLNLSNNNKTVINDKVVMEVKTSTSIPLWLVTYFNELNIYKQSFSKYGTVYKDYLYNRGEQ